MTRRYYSLGSSESRVVAYILGGLGTAYIALVGVLLGSSARSIPEVVAAASLPGWGLVAAAVWSWRSKHDSVVVDLSQRRAARVSGGKEVWTGALDELGPVRVVAVERPYTRKGSTGSRMEYRVVAGASNVPMSSDWSYPPARRRAARLARLWRVPLCEFNGRVRQAGDIDAPLATATAAFSAPKPAPLVEAKSFTVVRELGRTVVQSQHASRGGEAPNWLWGLAAAMMVAAISETPYDAVLAEPIANPLNTIGIAVLALAALAAVARLLIETRQWLTPATVIIDANSVTYAARRIPTATVTEVAAAGGSVYLLTPRRTLEVRPGFALPAETTRFAGTLRQVLSEHAAARAASR